MPDIGAQSLLSGVQRKILILQNTSSRNEKASQGCEAFHEVRANRFGRLRCSSSLIDRDISQMCATIKATVTLPGRGHAKTP